MDVSIIGHFLARRRFGRLLLINRGNTLQVELMNPRWSDSGRLIISRKRRSHSGGFKNRIHRKHTVTNELCNDIAFSNLETTSADECSSELF